MAHLNKTSRVPWPQPKNLLGFRLLDEPKKTQQPKKENEDATMSPHLFSSPEGSPSELMEESDTEVTRGICASSDSGDEEEDNSDDDSEIESKNDERQGKDLVDASDGTNSTNTSSNRTRMTRAQRQRMDMLLLAAEHASSSTYRAASPSVSTEEKGGKETAEFAGGDSIFGREIPSSMKSWRWYNKDGDEDDAMDSKKKDQEEVEVEKDSALESPEDTNKNTTKTQLLYDPLSGLFTYDSKLDDRQDDDDDKSSDSGSGSDSSSECGSDSDEDSFDLFSETTVVIREGRAQYTVHRIPTIVVDEEESENEGNETGTDGKCNANANTSSGTRKTYAELCQALLDFRDKFGHANVPSSKAFSEYSDLAKWVCNQRYKYKQVRTMSFQQGRTIDVTESSLACYSIVFLVRMIFLTTFVFLYTSGSADDQTSRIFSLAQGRGFSSNWQKWVDQSWARCRDCFLGKEATDRCNYKYCFC